MKRFSTLFSGLILSVLCWSQSAQTVTYHYVEDFYFVKEVPVVEHAGKNFRYEIAVQSHPLDTLSKVRIHGIAAGKGKDAFINSDFEVETREEQDWTIYTVIGKVQPEAMKLWFYASVNGNGSFYFDDLNFYIEQSAGEWTQLALFNHSFEEKSWNIFAGYFVSTRRSPTVKTQLSKQVFKTGHNSLQVTTNNSLVAGSGTAVVNTNTASK